MALLERTDTLEPIREKVEAGERLDLEDGLALMESDDVLALGALADRARRRREPARGLRLLRRHRAAPARSAAGRAPETLHGERNPPHDDAVRPHARRGPAGATRRG